MGWKRSKLVGKEKERINIREIEKNERINV